MCLCVLTLFVRCVSDVLSDVAWFVFVCVSGRVCLRYVPVRFVCLTVLCDAIWSVLAFLLLLFDVVFVVCACLLFVLCCAML